MAKTPKAAKLSQTMEEALVYLGRGAYRAHLEPEKRTVLALERRGMIVWSDRAELGDVGGYRVHDLTRLWDVTEAGWAFLKEAYGMDRPADDGRLTVEEALELVLVDGDRAYDHTEITARLRSAYRFGDGLLANPAYDASGITAFLVKLGLAEESVENHGGRVVFYTLSAAGEEAARMDTAWINDEDGDVAMDADALAAANFAAHRPDAKLHRLQGDRPMNARMIRTADPEPVGTSPVAVPGVLKVQDGPLAAGDRVIVRRSTFDYFNRTWTAQEPVEGFYRRPIRNDMHAVEITGRTVVPARRSEIHPDTRLTLKDALIFADLARRTGLDIDGWDIPAGWPTAPKSKRRPYDALLGY